MEQLSKSEVREIYDGIAPWFDLLEAVPERLGVGRLRRRLLERARGAVLEVAVGTGRNLRHYPAGCRVTGIDLSRGMLEQAREAAGALGRPTPLVQADAERLPFPDDAFDTVVDSLTVCTYPDPVRALGEMARVCRPGGRLLLFEHGRSDRGWLARLQERWAEGHYRRSGCRWDRRPAEIVERAGLVVREAERTLLGVLHLVEAEPPRPGVEASG